MKRKLLTKKINKPKKETIEPFDKFQHTHIHTHTHIVLNKNKTKSTIQAKPFRAKRSVANGDQPGQCHHRGAEGALSAMAGTHSGNVTDVQETSNKLSPAGTIKIEP